VREISGVVGLEWESEEMMDGESSDGKKLITRMWANVMVALPNIGGALCSTPQTLADAHY